MKKIFYLLLLLCFFININVYAEENIPKTLINIDYPVNNQSYSNSIRVLGWVMSEAPNSTVEFQIDNGEIISSSSRQVRNDVIKAINGYGTITENPTPGYDESFNISYLNYGSHNIKVIAKDSQGRVLSIANRSFIKKAPKTLINIDYPVNNQSYSNSIRVLGWVMSEAPNSTVEFQIDNGEIISSSSRQVRNDVIKAINGYGTITENPTPGYDESFNISYLNYGSHNIKVIAKDSQGRVLSIANRSFIKKAPKTLINIDSPTTFMYGKEIAFFGWYLSAAKDDEAKLEIYLDNNAIDYNRSLRQDVYDAYGNQYTRNTTYPGFYKVYNVESLNDGYHTLTVKLISNKNNQVISEQKRVFKLIKVKSRLNIDYLEQSETHNAFFLSGWEMSSQPNSYIKVFVDGALTNTNINRIGRPDVINAITGYGTVNENPNPGIYGYIDISNMSLGSHTIKIALYSKYNEEIASDTRNIYIYTKNYYNNKLYYNNVPYFNQYDGRWSNITYGLSIFGKNGCGPTAFAMAFSSILGRTIYPNQVADYLYYNTNEFNKIAKGSGGLAIVYATDAYHIKRTPIYSLEQLNSALNEGKIVYAAMGNGRYATPFWNHSIIMYGYNSTNGYTYTVDPLTTNNNIWISTATVWSQRSTDPDDSRGGAFFYALESYY